MKITEVGTCRVSADSDASYLVFVRTDDGYVGVGEAPVTRCPSTLSPAIGDLKPSILGRDPFDVHSIRAALSSDRNSDGFEALLPVISGVEAACLDIVGKRLGVSVAQLFGGSLREYVRLCATRWEHPDDSPEDYAQKARRVADSGFTALKFDPFGRIGGVLPTIGPALDRAVEITRSVRKEVGTAVDLIVDANGRFTPSEAIRIARAFEPFALLWIEDPLGPDDLDWWEKVAGAVAVPIAAGGRSFAGGRFRDVIERQLTDFVLPDLCSVGGVHAVRDVALLAETYFMSFALHHSGGPVSLAIEAQIGACAPNFAMMELPYGSSESWDRLLKAPLQLKDGHLKVPTGPGWGIEYRHLLELQSSGSGAVAPVAAGNQ
ncbi:MAG: mandelate racemase/muconate lactonizing enzyme family protein [Acidobacteriia bacterium]|nr:mandelate racemase/muconate lactonizing enzyme family protein [Terriglobia bacterium]